MDTGISGNFPFQMYRKIKVCHSRWMKMLIYFKFIKETWLVIVIQMKYDSEEPGYFDKFEINLHFHPGALAVQSKL
jgi:hypothetical protein